MSKKRIERAGRKTSRGRTQAQTRSSFVLSSDEDEVRPIGARALKSAIDTLRPKLFGASVLDLFAGQGRFGLSAGREAVESLAFVEKDRSRAREIEAALQHPGYPKPRSAQVFCQDVFHFLEHCSQTFDILFADPPFPQWNEDFVVRLENRILKVMSEESILLVKSPSRMVGIFKSSEFQLIKTSTFGESRLSYFGRKKG